MESLRTIYEKPFSHIYVEERAADYPLARRLLDKFHDSTVIAIRHYKDVFNKPGQSFVAQKNSPKLILAVKERNFFYEGSPMCDSFGNERFLYTSHVMNCPYNCRYCYLQGLYPSANVVLFVNTEDYFREARKLLPAYICISYDTDLMALEALTGILKAWADFCGEPDNKGRVLIEVRTKSAAIGSLADVEPNENIILAWSLSPDSVIQRLERGTPGLTARLRAINEALARGFVVRLCVDPVMYSAKWRDEYTSLAETIKSTVDITRVKDFSVGVFRMPASYFKKLARLDAVFAAELESVTENRDGYITYKADIEREMTEYVKNLLCIQAMQG